MPISRERFERERGLEDTEMKILEFLEQRPDEAFTLAEILEGIDFALTQPLEDREIDLPTVVDAAATTAALIPLVNELEGLHLIKSKTTSSGRYCTVSR